jgi:hypothetical protein
VRPASSDLLTRLAVDPRLLPLGLLTVKLGKLHVLTFELTPTLCLVFRLAPPGTYSGRYH